MGKDLPQFGACGSLKQGPCSLITSVKRWTIEILTDRLTHPVQRESKEQRCNTTRERRGGVEF